MSLVHVSDLESKRCLGPVGMVSITAASMSLSTVCLPWEAIHRPDLTICLIDTIFV
jgi:hypothetical protein